MDDALGLAVGASQVLDPGGGSVAPTPPPPFDWADYTNLESRYDFTDLTTMFTSQAASFDGTNYLEIDQAAVTAYPLTMLCWFKLDGASSGLMWVGDKDSDTDYQALYADGTTVYAASISTTDGAESATVSDIDPDDGSWHFGAAVFTSGDARSVYADTFSGPDAGHVDIDATFDRTTIGRYGDLSPGFYVDGSIDNAYIFSVALSADEITYMRTNKPTYDQLVVQYAAGATNCPNPANVAGYWGLNETEGLRVDGSGNSLDLTPGSNGLVATFVRTSSEQLRDNTASPQTSMPLTMCCWYRSDDTGETTNLMTNQTSGTGLDYQILFANSSNQIGVKQRDNSAGATVASYAPTINGHDNAWHFCSAVMASTTSRQFFCDAEKSAEDTVLNAVAVGSFAEFRLGAWEDSQYASCDMSMAMIFNKALSEAEHLWLYNSGSGRTVYELSNSADANNPGEPDHLWKLNEASGNRADTFGSFTLTDVGTVGSTASVAPVAEVPERVAGTVNTDAVVGGLVSLVLDQTANGNDLTQSDLTKRPEVVAVADGTGIALQFDGVDDYLQSAAFSAALSQPNTIFLTVDITDNSADQGLIDGIVGTSEQSLQVNSTGDLLRIDGGTAASTTIGADYGTLHTIVGLFSGAASEVFQDGGTGEVESAGAETMTGVTVGTINDGSTEPAKGTYRQIAINDGSMTDDEMDAIGGKLAADQGLTWTTIV